MWPNRSLPNVVASLRVPRTARLHSLTRRLNTVLTGRHLYRQELEDKLALLPASAVDTEHTSACFPSRLNAATVLQECTVANSDTPQQLCPLLQARNHRPSLTEPRPSLSQSTVTDSITATHCHCCRINCSTAGQTERRCDTAHCVDSTAFRLITRNQYTPLCRQINVLSLIRSRYDTRPS